MASSSALLLVILSLTYGIFSTATFAYLYLFYQNKLVSLTDQCSVNSVQDNEPKIIDINVGSNEGFISSVRPPVYRNIQDIEHSECVCSTKRSGVNGEEGWLNKGYIYDSESGSGDRGRSHDYSFLRCCTANDTTLYEKLMKWTKHDFIESENTAVEDDVKTILVVGSEDYQNEQIGRFSGVIRRWSTNNDRESGYLKGIQFDDGSLIVPKDGYYLVYSKVGLRTLSGDNHHPCRSVTIGHSTSVGSEDRPEDQNLMHSEKLHSCSDLHIYSSFHSGIFRLFRDDRVYVRVDIPESIDVTFVPDSSSFGMYLFS